MSSGRSPRQRVCARAPAGVGVCMNVCVSAAAFPASVASCWRRSTLRQSCDLCLHLVTAFCSLLQNTPTQNQVDGSLQSELMPVHTSSPQTPPTEHIAQPPSTVDTAALSEDPLPGEGTTHLLEAPPGIKMRQDLLQCSLQNEWKVNVTPSVKGRPEH